MFGNLCFRLLLILDGEELSTGFSLGVVYHALPGLPVLMTGTIHSLLQLLFHYHQVFTIASSLYLWPESAEKRPCLWLPSMVHEESDLHILTCPC